MGPIQPASLQLIIIGLNHCLCCELKTYRNVFQGSVEVKAAGGGVVVSVGLQLHPSIPEDGGVVSPGRLGQIHVTCTSMKARLKRDKHLVMNLRPEFHLLQKSNNKKVRTLPGSWLRCAEIQFLRWFVQ